MFLEIRIECNEIEKNFFFFFEKFNRKKLYIEDLECDKMASDKLPFCSMRVMN